ncbi:hypothetical protein A2U01_0115152, partial [Trifolium medium]|nr:hypothetical protein [Trifolium medium]
CHGEDVLSDFVEKVDQGMYQYGYNFGPGQWQSNRGIPIKEGPKTRGFTLSFSLSAGD